MPAVPQPWLVGAVLVGGMPASASLHKADVLAKRVMERHGDDFERRTMLSRDRLRSRVTALTRLCLRVMASTLDGDAMSQELVGGLRRVGAGWARDGVPIEVLHHVIHGIVRTVLQEHVAAAAAASIDALTAIGLRLVESMNRISAMVASAYLDELRAMAGERQSARRALATGLLEGRSCNSIARECGVALADSYFVVSMTLSDCLPGHEPARPDQTWARTAAMRRVLDGICADALEVLEPAMAMLLVPSEFGESRLDSLIAELGRAGDARITAVVAACDRSAIPHTSRWTRELLEVADKSRRGAGLYRFADLALDYQITRPGPARGPMSALLDPLQHHPDLFHTLCRYVDLDLNVKRTARSLNVHPNTIHYRFTRITQLVGIDPLNPTGAWQLRSALLARRALDAPTSFAPPA